MSYIGNLPTNVAFVTDQFNGDGSTVAFTMSVAPATTSSILVAVTGVLQDPSTYSVSGTTLTFSAAPPSGTGNISVRYLGIPASGITTTAYRTVTEFTATAGQTSFSVPSYTVGYINVYRNGALLGTADYTATTGTTVVLAAGATVGDLVVTESFYVSSVLNAIPATAGAVNSTYIAAGAVGSTQLGSGAVLRANMGANGTWAPAGTVLQVAQGTLSSIVTSSSSTFADTGLTASITPTSSSSKILVSVSLNQCGKYTGDTSMKAQLLRGSSVIAYMSDISGYTGTTATNIFGTLAIDYLDSPATTSSTTYKVQFASNANVATVSIGTTFSGQIAVSTITLMEIAA